MWLTLLLCSAVVAGPDVPMPEETAALLLSPNQRLREQGRELIARDLGRRYERDVIGRLARWAGDREGWIATLEKRSSSASGIELRRVQRMLGHLADVKDETIVVEILFVAVPPAVAGRILAPGGGTAIHAAGPAWKSWLGALRSDKAAEILFQRSIPTRDTRPASFSIGRQVSYVKRYDHDEQRNVVSTVVETIEAGVKMSWTPQVSADRRFLTLHAEIQLTDLERPIPTSEIRLGGRVLKLQVPRIETLTMRQSVTLPTGGSCAWRIPDPAAKPQDHAVLVLLRSSVASR